MRALPITLSKLKAANGWHPGVCAAVCGERYDSGSFPKISPSHFAFKGFMPRCTERDNCGSFPKISPSHFAINWM
jgi:hypothetical protein